MQLAERVAVGTLVSLIGGFLIAVALGGSNPVVLLEDPRAFLIWLLTVVCAGVAVGRTETSVWDVSGAAFPALALASTPVLYFYFLAVVAFIKNSHFVIIIFWQQFPVNPFSPTVITALLILWMACFIASFMFISVSMMASQMVLAGAQKLYKFGPKGVNRVKTIVLGIAGVVVAAFFLL